MRAKFRCSVGLGQLHKQSVQYKKITSMECPHLDRCVCVCVGMFMWFMRTQICIITWVWHRYYKEKVIYEDIFSVPII